MKIITPAVNNIDFIELQFNSLKKHVKIPYDFIVFNDGKNSKEAFEIINKLGVYNPDESDLIKDSLEKVNDLELRKQAMEFVRDNHTYLNRIDTLQDIFKLKQAI